MSQTRHPAPDCTNPTKTVKKFWHKTVTFQIFVPKLPGRFSASRKAQRKLSASSTVCACVCVRARACVYIYVAQLLVFVFYFAGLMLAVIAPGLLPSLPRPAPVSRLLRASARARPMPRTAPAFPAAHHRTGMRPLRRRAQGSRFYRATAL